MKFYKRSGLNLKINPKLTLQIRIMKGKRIAMPQIIINLILNNNNNHFKIQFQWIRVNKNPIYF